MEDRGQEGWERVAGAEDLADGEMRRVSAFGRDLALYRIDGRYYASDDTCTHALASLSEGFLDGETVECPLHQACFHVPTGRVLAPPAVLPLAVYPVRARADGIWVGAAPATDAP